MQLGAPPRYTPFRQRFFVEHVPGAATTITPFVAVATAWSACCQRDTARQIFEANVLALTIKTNWWHQTITLLQYVAPYHRYPPVCPNLGLAPWHLSVYVTRLRKVGAALSMCYKTGQPILFVGTGQKYTHLRKLNVNYVIKALFG